MRDAVRRAAQLHLFTYIVGNALFWTLWAATSVAADRWYWWPILLHRLGTRARRASLARLSPRPAAASVRGKRWVWMSTLTLVWLVAPVPSHVAVRLATSRPVHEACDRAAAACCCSTLVAVERHANQLDHATERRAAESRATKSSIVTASGSPVRVELGDGQRSEAVAREEHRERLERLVARQADVATGVLQRAGRR